MKKAGPFVTGIMAGLMASQASAMDNTQAGSEAAPSELDNNCMADDSLIPQCLDTMTNQAYDAVTQMGQAAFQDENDAKGYQIYQSLQDDCAYKLEEVLTAPFDDSEGAIQTDIDINSQFNAVSAAIDSCQAVTTNYDSDLSALPGYTAMQEVYARNDRLKSGPK